MAVNHPRPRFTFLGHAAVRCDLPGGEVLLIDPWVSNPVCPASARVFERIDAVLITHAHSDHLGDAVELCKKHRPKIVVATHEICGWLAEQGVEGTSGMNLGGSQSVLSLRVSMVRADHSSGLKAPTGFLAGAFFDGGVAAGFVIRLSTGYTFYHAGDTALFSDMQLIHDLYRPELAFLPIGDHYTMDPVQAARACRFLGVRRVVPIHWGTFPILVGRPEQLRAEIEKLGINCEVIALAPGESY